MALDNGPAIVQPKAGTILFSSKTPYKKQIGGFGVEPLAIIDHINFNNAASTMQVNGDHLFSGVGVYGLDTVFKDIQDHLHQLGVIALYGIGTGLNIDVELYAFFIDGCKYHRPAIINDAFKVNCLSFMHAFVTAYQLALDIQDLLYMGDDVQQLGHRFIDFGYAVGL